MTPYQNRLTKNTARMAGDMKIRHFAQATIDAYTYHVGRFAEFLGEVSIQEATPEQVRDFQLHLIEVRKIGWSSFNQAVCGLRFLYRVTFPKPWPVAMIPFGKRPKRLPVVLGSDEVDQLLQCVPNLKHRTCLMTLYACGLRLAEGSNLKIPDIDSSRMQLRVRAGTRTTAAATTTTRVNRRQSTAAVRSAVRRSVSKRCTAASPKHTGQVIALPYCGFGREILSMQRMPE